MFELLLYLILRIYIQVERYDRIGPNLSPSRDILVKSSPSTTISIMIGTASNESSHILYVEIVLIPSIKILEEYSSKALFESPTNGIYLIITSDYGY